MMEIFQQYEISQTEMNEKDYPGRLSAISRAPVRLYYRGNIAVINQKRNIAVIGSRHMSGAGKESAYRMGYELGRKGVNVVNGLALGCDTYALKGALEAGGTCVAVLPCGLDQVVPWSNIRLAEKLLSNGGCLVSEYPVRTPVRRYQYVERDRLQSGISDGVLMIEAEQDSGTMHTVNYAIKQGRRLVCMDSRLMKYASGNQWLEGRNGVRVIRSVCSVAVLDDFIADVNNDVGYRQLALQTSGQG